jgi:hypothetical protein
VQNEKFVLAANHIPEIGKGHSEIKQIINDWSNLQTSQRRLEVQVFSAFKTQNNILAEACNCG